MLTYIIRFRAQLPRKRDFLALFTRGTERFPCAQCLPVSSMCPEYVYWDEHVRVQHYDLSQAQRYFLMNKYF